MPKSSNPSNSSTCSPERSILGAQAVAILRGLLTEVANRSSVRLFVATNPRLANVQLEAKRVTARWHDLDVAEGRVEPAFDSAFCPECGGNHPEEGGHAR